MTFQIARQIMFSARSARKRLSTSQLNRWKASCGVLLLCVAVPITASAQTFTTVASFTGTDGAQPDSPLIQGLDGNLYGTASTGGTYGYGAVFKFTSKGGLSTIYSFCSETGCPDGSTPMGLVQSTDGNLYGTTAGGGAYGGGTAFRIGRGGSLTTIYSFCVTQPACWPPSGPTPGRVPSVLIQASDGNLYGTAQQGGISNDVGCLDPNNWQMFSCGTVFKITPGGTFTELYFFCSVEARYECLDGWDPGAPLIQGNDGNFYGTANNGLSGNGTIFKLTPEGRLTVFKGLGYPFVSSPVSGLIQGADGYFYGTTSNTFVLGVGTEVGGTVFKASGKGTLTLLYNFCSQTNCTDGASPAGALVQATDGNLYGTTSSGGIATGCGGVGCGTVFKMTTQGSLTTLHVFCRLANCPDGINPAAALLQSTDGNFYGTTLGGGGSAMGSIFRLSMGMHPFVAFLQNSGKVGTTAQILGQALSGATSVFFNGIPAKFTIQSDTYLTATVPAGAQWGFVTVTTPSGTLKSNKAFRVTPQIFSLSASNGSVGNTIVITGMSLARTYAVTFGVTQASFVVDSDTQVTVTVPSGAQNGKIAVLTPGGTAYSPTCFDVTP